MMKSASKVWWVNKYRFHNFYSNSSYVLERSNRNGGMLSTTQIWYKLRIKKKADVNVGKWNNHTLIMFAKTRLFANVIFFDILNFWKMSHHKKLALKLTKWIFLLKTIFGKFRSCITENDERNKMSIVYLFDWYNISINESLF